ncbi:hypothetical protein BDN70DRAFT_975054 [Pholiota conissans]|uniref:C2H2-type domain-containing protein n=1 Tax=Pholiota conissans TaxID=109636 RepID=A0A9P5YMS7_9AGAR|nr:hypothetical protein BDN70DRAFT_975054 [Pholiota conissans]
MSQRISAEAERNASSEDSTALAEDEVRGRADAAHPCLLCDDGFPSVYKLKKHMNTMHDPALEQQGKSLKKKKNTKSIIKATPKPVQSVTGDRESSLQLDYVDSVGPSRTRPQNHRYSPWNLGTQGSRSSISSPQAAFYQNSLGLYNHYGQNIPGVYFPTSEASSSSPSAQAFSQPVETPVPLINHDWANHQMGPRVQNTPYPTSSYPTPAPTPPEMSAKALGKRKYVESDAPNAPSVHSIINPQDTAGTNSRKRARHSYATGAPSSLSSSASTVAQAQPDAYGMTPLVLYTQNGYAVPRVQYDARTGSASSNSSALAQPRIYPAHVGVHPQYNYAIPPSQSDSRQAKNYAPSVPSKLSSSPADRKTLYFPIPPHIPVNPNLTQALFSSSLSLPVFAQVAQPNIVAPRTANVGATKRKRDDSNMPSASSSSPRVFAQAGSMGSTAPATVVARHSDAENGTPRKKARHAYAPPVTPPRSSPIVIPQPAVKDLLWDMSKFDWDGHQFFTNNSLENSLSVPPTDDTNKAIKGPSWKELDRLLGLLPRTSDFAQPSPSVPRIDKSQQIPSHCLTTPSAHQESLNTTPDYLFNMLPSSIQANEVQRAINPPLHSAPPTNYLPSPGQNLAEYSPFTPSSYIDENTNTFIPTKDLPTPAQNMPTLDYNFAYYPPTVNPHATYYPQIYGYPNANATFPTNYFPALGNNLAHYAAPTGYVTDANVNTTLPTNYLPTPVQNTSMPYHNSPYYGPSFNPFGATYNSPDYINANANIQPPAPVHAQPQAGTNVPQPADDIDLNFDPLAGFDFANMALPEYASNPSE